MVIIPQNKPQTSNFLLSPLNQWLLGAANGKQLQTMMHLKSCETKGIVLSSKVYICSNLFANFI